MDHHPSTPVLSGNGRGYGGSPYDVDVEKGVTRKGLPHLPLDHPPALSYYFIVNFYDYWTVSSHLICICICICIGIGSGNGWMRANQRIYLTVDARRENVR